MVLGVEMWKLLVLQGYTSKWNTFIVISKAIVFQLNTVIAVSIVH